MLSLYTKRWKDEVKPLAEACVEEPEYVRLMINYEEKKPTEEEEAYLQEIQKKYKDLRGMFQISNMIWKVDGALDNGRVDVNSLLDVYMRLNTSNYLEEVFQGDSSSEEWKKRMALRDALKKLLILP